MNRQKTDPFPGASEMGARMRAFDWEQTSIGSVETWPQSLKSTVRILLGSRYPMILLWGQELAQIYNDAYTSLIGDKHPGALGRSIRETQSESWDTIGPMIAEVMTTGVPNWVEDQMMVVNRAGYNEEAHFSLSYSAVEDDEGVIRGMLCVCSEVTQQVLGERRLRLQRDLAARTGEMRSVDTTCQDIVAAITEYPFDVPFALIYLREEDVKTLRLYGSVGMGGNDSIAPNTVLYNESTDLWPFTTVMAGHTVLVEGVNRHIALAGGPWGEIVREALSLPIPSSNVNAPLGMLIVGISPSRALDESYQSFYALLAGQVSVSIRNAQAYEEERRRAEMLAEIDRAKTAFFSNVSHEFRTPLTLMLGPLEDVLQSPYLPSGEREQITVAHRNSLRLLKLVNTLLDFSRIEAGRIQAVYEPTDLATLTADLASVFRSAIEKAGLQLVVDCPPLPEPVYVDRDMWEKIVLNLLSNAFKFTQQGCITVRLSIVGEKVELHVADTGIGIPEAELGNVFKRFHRIEGTQGRTHEGSGIGLALVQELIQLHGGSVRVHSVYGQGSTFSVILSRGKHHLPADRIGSELTLTPTTVRSDAFLEEAVQWLPEKAQELNPSSFTLHPSKARILVADDNADMREYVRKLLSTEYDVVAVADGEAALAAVREQVPELVLSDVMMPKLDGFGLLAQLRKDPRTCSIPIVLLSARAGEESRIEGFEAGADDYLVKPFSARELLARIKATLETSRLRQETVRSRLEIEKQARSHQRVEELLQQLEVERSRLEQVLQQMPSGVAIAEAPSGKLLFHNEEAVRLIGHPMLASENYQGYAQYGAFHSEGTPYQPQEYPIARSVLFGEVVKAEEMLYRRGDGSYTFFSVNAAPIVDGEGRIIAAVSTFYDISAIKWAEKERDRLLADEKAARAEAESANRIKDEFLAILSHELRSPLNPILGWAKLLRSRKLDEQSIARALETIERNAKLQAQLIEDLLDVSRILRGKMVLNVSPVNLSATIEAAIETVRLAAEAKAIKIRTVLDSHVGLVSGDTNRLQQVVWNLLSNAVKFTPNGGQVEVLLEQTECYAQIQVKDTGIGISPEFLPHVFEYFRQENSATTRKFGGLGLGLAIVRYLTELHGGTVTVESPGEEQGATFSVKLPLMVAPGQTTQEEVQSDDGLNLSGVGVLVVDDEADMRELVAFALEQFGASVTVAGSATEALATVEQSVPDVLVSDIGMPDVDGYMLVRQLRAKPPEQGGALPAIALTAYAGDYDRRQALAAGFQLHVAKPIEPEQLVRAIRRLI